MMQVLIIGKTGQLARAIAYQSNGLAGIRFAGRPDIDLTDPGSVHHMIAQVCPDIVINTAAFTDVEDAETNPLAWAVNADGAGHVAEACARCGAALIHISTDYVFAGHDPYLILEDDQALPINAYGASKLQGEQLALRANPRTVIVRTSWLFSPWGRNFVTTMLDLARTRRSVPVVGDQLGNPTPVLDLARVLLDMAPRVAGAGSVSDLWGPVHVTGQGTASWACLADEVFRQAQPSLGPSRPRLVRITSDDWPTKATRPRNTALDTTRLGDVFGLSMPPWQDGLRRTLAMLAEQDALV